MLLAVALLACTGVAVLLNALASVPALLIGASADAQGRIVLGASRQAELQNLEGRVLLAIGPATGNATPVPVNAALLHRVPRWQSSDGRRAESLAQHQALATIMDSGALRLHMADGSSVDVPVRARGLAHLGLLPWPLVMAALLLPMFGCVVLMARPNPLTGLFMLVSLSQAVGLGFLAAGSMSGLGQPMPLLRLDLPVRASIDILGATAVAYGFAFSQPGRRPQAAALWFCSAAVALGVALGWLTPAWPWVLVTGSVLALWALAAVRRTPDGLPDPRRLFTGRLTLTALATWLLVHGAVWATAGLPAVSHAVAAGAAMAWGLFVLSLLLMAPFQARSRPLLRELALLAGISIVTASLDLLFVAVFSLNATASLAVAVFIALAVYAFARQQLLDRLLGSQRQTTDRVFELLYRAARDVQRRPERRVQRLAQLLREVFEPLEVQRSVPEARQSQVSQGGASLVVPIRSDGEDGEKALALRLRLAARGRRLFQAEDARLADRIVEQLRRAVAYDEAVERGRHEERRRLAQDLHDDIGARLLTLMYQAPTPELEDYIRLTLKDLKTLTRGLAVAEHRLGPAAAEWKADITQRLTAAQATLGWSCQVDDTQLLSVGQWSALTRVLRELVTNALYHGRATRVDVAIEVDGSDLSLSVADDGVGRSPQAWSHGLGMGGVRKRVKQLGGTVTWSDNGERGIVCRVLVPGFTERR